jgi:alpha-glucosidase (family GH31 glycosyl hydrolase)
MIEFSLASWRVLDDRHLAAALAAVRTRQAVLPDLRALFSHAAQTGEPILRPLAYHFAGYEPVQDQSLLGEDILCAPVLDAGANSRHVALPPGRWKSGDGSVIEGPADLALQVSLESLPWRRRIRA